ncbi:MAG: isoprenoid biosynthesis glyoxalase ElbB [Bacteroidales bacterium]|jgi:enhancing lycopene biosynthesis protein 2|nr:isoprenoid biosynthesis glyoxalase ElbB [Bacteroidales bacterium]
MKFAVVLAGCGVYDGAEIHEATMTMLAIDRNGGEYEIFAPNIKQLHVINHLTGEVMDESRNVLVEAARIARGRIRALSEYKQADFEGLIFPGGFGVAKNLCSYAVDGTDMRIDKVVGRAVLETHAAGKPIGALCISPVMIAALIPGAEITLGSDDKYDAEVASLGGRNRTTANRQVVTDKKNRIVTTPCYMNDATIADIAEGADMLVKELIRMISDF